MTGVPAAPHRPAPPGRRTATQFGGGVAVVTHRAIGTVRFDDLHERAERNHFAAGVASLEARHVFGAIAERRVGLRDDLVGAAEAVKVIHVK